MSGTIRERRIPPAEVGPMIAAARLRAGYRGAQCARAVGISRAYLVMLESGQRSPSATVAQSLASALKLTDDERSCLIAASVAQVGKDRGESADGRRIRAGLSVEV